MFRWHDRFFSSSAELYQVPVLRVAMPIMWFYLLMNVVTQYPFAGSFIHVSVLLWQRNGHSNNGGGLSLRFALTSVVSCRWVDPLLKLLCRRERDCGGAGQVGRAEETGLCRWFRASHAMRCNELRFL